MPLYEFECPRCHHRTEELHPYPPPALDVCEYCGHPANLVTAIKVAATPGRWGHSHGQYIPALGGYIENSQMYDKRLNERGLVPLEDVGEAKLQSAIDKQRRGNEQADRLSREINRRAEEIGGRHPDQTALALATGDVLTPERVVQIEREGDL